MNLELRLTPSSVETSAPLSKRKSDVNFPVLEIVGIVGSCVASKRVEKKKPREKWSEHNTTQKKKKEERKKKKKKKEFGVYRAGG